MEVFEAILCMFLSPCARKPFSRSAFGVILEVGELVVMKHIVNVHGNSQGADKIRLVCAMGVIQ